MKSALPVDKAVFDRSIPAHVAFSPKLAEHNCTMGAWLEVADLRLTTDLFKSVLMADELSNADGMAVLKCRVINKKFTSFLWILREKNDRAAPCFNDDGGLSTVGWIARGMDGLDELATQHGLRASGHFDVLVGGRTLKAAFLYDNRSASHEMLSV